MSRDSLRKTILGGLFILPFIPLLVSSSFFFPFITTKAFVFRAVVEIIFGLWIVLAIAVPEFRPRRGAILYGVLIFVVLVGFADFAGLTPVKSFWSNFERMEGYVLILHLGALFLVMSSVMKEREWRWWWNTSLAAAAIMVIYCVFQLLGAADIHQGGVRIDGTIGNAAYLALYMLFHIFIASYYFTKSRGGLRWTYGFFIVALAFTLYETATRGAILGLIGAVGVIAVLNLFNKENKRARRYSIYSLATLLIIVAVFFSVKNTDFVKNSQVLSRFSNLSLSEWKSEGRSFIWPMAIKGIKERPLLGWGQDNFNYVFAEHYSPEMYHLEPWFDRAHNVFLDWGIAGGLPTLFSYISLYILILIAVWKREGFDFTERTMLTGLVAAYFFNNLFIFDNLVSYTLFFALIAYVFTRTTKPKNTGKVLGDGLVVWLSVPTAIFMIFALYFVVVKPVVANNHLILAIQSLNSTNAGDKAVSMDEFEKAYNGSRLGRPEVVEQMSTSASTLLADTSISDKRKTDYYDFASKAVEKLTTDIPNDPRNEIIAGNFYLNLGLFDQALTHLNKALAIMPEKQAIYYSVGETLFYKKDYQASLAAFQKAYDLDKSNNEAKKYLDIVEQQIPK